MISVILFGMMFAETSMAQFMRIDAKFYSSSLDTVKNVDIYLPPDYFVDSASYPVIYFLHAANDNQNGANVPAAFYFSNVHTGAYKPVIMIAPDASCDPYLGSMYVNSVLYGDYYDYFLEDVIRFTESNFRVVGNKYYRYLSGLSMGAQGSLQFLTDHPEMFRAAFAQQGNPCVECTIDFWKEQLYLENDNSYQFVYGNGTMTDLYFTISGGYCPNLSLPPYFIEHMWDTLGNRVDSVFDKWMSFDIARKVKAVERTDTVAYFITCGTEDQFGFYPSNVYLDQLLDTLDLDHGSYFHPGGHGIYDPGALQGGFSFIDSLIRRAPALGITPDRMPAAMRVNLHPNPCRERFTVSYSLGTACDVFTEVWSASGVLKLTAEDFSQTPGFYQKEYNVAGLSPGFYIVTIRTGNARHIAKLVVTR